MWSQERGRGRESEGKRMKREGGREVYRKVGTDGSMSEGWEKKSRNENAAEEEINTLHVTLQFSLVLTTVMYLIFEVSVGSCSEERCCGSYISSLSREEES